MNSHNKLETLPRDCLSIIASFCDFRTLTLLCQVNKRFSVLIPGFNLAVNLPLPDGIRGRDLGLNNLNTNTGIKSNYKQALTFFKKNQVKLKKLNGINTNSMVYVLKPDGTEAMEIGGLHGSLRMLSLRTTAGSLAFLVTLSMAIGLIEVGLMLTSDRRTPYFSEQNINRIVMCVVGIFFCGFVGYILTESSHRRQVSLRDNLRNEIATDLLTSQDINVISLTEQPSPLPKPG